MTHTIPGIAIKDPQTGARWRFCNSAWIRESAVGPAFYRQNDERIALQRAEAAGLDLTDEVTATWAASKAKACGTHGCTNPIQPGEPMCASCRRDNADDPGSMQ